MRIKNSLKNSGISFITNILRLMISFFLRRIFLIKLGEVYLGLNGLLINVISMFSLIELGIGGAIGYSLYKPLAEKNHKNIALKMNFFKSTYRLVAIIILGIGIIVYPFLDEIIKTQEINKEVIVVAYFLFVCDTSISYLFSYKKILLEADQKSYKLNLINTIFFILTSFFQYIILIVYKNFIMYIIIKVIFNFVSNYICAKIVDQSYSYLKKFTNIQLEEIEKKEIITNTKALFLHKIGDICINSTDNIIIAKYINLSSVGLFSNYIMIINAAQGIVIQIFTSMISSIGNLIIDGNEKKTNEIFNVLNFICFFIFGLMTTVFYCSIQEFIKIWIGEEYIIRGVFLVVISLNMYMTGMRVVTGIVKSAAGYYTQDKYSPLIQAVINLFFSIYLAKDYGIVGVLLGTLISSMIPNIYRPYIIYKYLLKKSVCFYYKIYLKYLFITMASIIISNKIINNIANYNSYSLIFINIIVSGLSFIFLAVSISIKSEEVIYIKENIIKKLGVKL